MKIIWAPWRKSYITNCHKQSECFFCDMIKDSEDQKNLILYRSTSVFVVLNKFPYTNGHLMIVPYDHVSNLSDLDSEKMLDLLSTTSKAIQWLSASMNPQGYNIGMNLGKIAGAGLENHIHMHVVPRWLGDLNFMTCISETRIISESLSENYQSILNVIKS